MASDCSMCSTWFSSIIKKQVMAITGLMLCGFLVTHLAGNFLIFVSDEAFNTYAHTLLSNPLIYVAEAILATLFLTHIAMAISLTIENKRARPMNYVMKKHPGRGATFASASMPYTGAIILLFLILHLIHFKFGEVYLITHNGTEMRNLHRVVLEYFSDPLQVGWYLFAMVAMGIHLSHGFWSAFQSLGFSHPKYTPLLKQIAFVYAVLMTVGFSSIPIYCFLNGGNL